MPGSGAQWRGIDMFDFLKEMWAAADGGGALRVGGRAAALVGSTPPDSVFVRHRFESRVPDDEPVAAEALATRKIIIVEDPDIIATQYPTAADGEFRGGTLVALPVLHISGAPLSVVSFAWDQQPSLAGGELEDLQLIAELVSRNHVRSWSMEQAQAEVARSSGIARLAEALSSAQTLDEMLDFVAEQVPLAFDAAGAIVGIVDDNEQVLRRWFGEILTGSLAAAYRKTPLTSTMPMVTSAVNGTIHLFPDRESVDKTHPETLDGFDAAGYVSFASLPLRDRDGEVIGSLGIGWPHPTTFTQSLQDALATAAALVAQMFQRTLLAERLATAHNRAAFLSRFAGRLALASTPADVEAAVTEELLHFQRVSSAELTWAERDGVIPGVASPDDRPGEADLVAAAHIGLLAAPITAADGSLLGSLTIRWEPDPVVQRQVGPTLAIGVEMLAATMQRILLSNAEHQLITELQTRALVTAPPVPGLEIATHYRPAASQVAMGGDWYQTITLPSGRLALVVGDLVGHGSAAAIDMTQLSGIIAALLRVGTPLERIFLSVEDAVEPLGVMATVAICEIDPVTRMIRYVSAGHPPLVLVGADGSATLLQDGRSPLVGVPTRSVVAGVAEFPVGSVLVAYTDGLVERRTERLDEGFERVRRAAEECHEGPLAGALADLITRCTDGAPTEDDISAVAVRSVDR